jgi:hypothetical protein
MQAANNGWQSESCRRVRAYRRASGPEYFSAVVGATDGDGHLHAGDDAPAEQRNRLSASPFSMPAERRLKSTLTASGAWCKMR